MYKVYTENGTQIEDYVGSWYPNQYQPQEIYLEIDTDADPIIDYNGEIGNAIPFAVYHRRILRLGLSGSVYSQAMVDYILEDLKEEIKVLENSYEEYWDGNNHRGQWNESLIEALEQKVKSYETDCYFDGDGEFEEEENEE